MKSSSSSSSLCLGAHPRDSRDTLQYQEAGRQEKVILAICPRRQKYKMSQSSPHGACSLFGMMSRGVTFLLPEGKTKEKWLSAAQQSFLTNPDMNACLTLKSFDWINSYDKSVLSSVVIRNATQSFSLSVYKKKLLFYFIHSLIPAFHLMFFFVFLCDRNLSFFE